MPPRKAKVSVASSENTSTTSTSTRPTRSSRSSAAATSKRVSTSSSAQDEPEDVKPVLRPSRSSLTQNAPAPTAKSTRATRASNTSTRGKKVVAPPVEVEREPTPEEETPTPEPEVEEGEEEEDIKPVITREESLEEEEEEGDEEEVDEESPQQQEETAPESILEQRVAAVEEAPPASEEEKPFDKEEEEATPPKATPTPSVTPAPATQITTAHDLASAARLAAINHAAMEKEREKEMEGKPRLVIHQLVLEDFKSYRGRGVIGPFHKSFSSVVGPNGSGKSNTIDALLFVFGYKAKKMRQGKLSELIHNSGVVDKNAKDVEEGDLGGVEETPKDVAAGEGSDFEDDYESEEDWDAGKKGKGKKGKGKGKGKGKAVPVEDTRGLIGSCMVEVWFREIIDLPGDDFEVVPNSQLVVSRTAFRDNSSTYKINGKKSNFKEVTDLLKGRGIDLDHNRFLILQGEVESIAQMKPKGATEHDEGLLEYLEDIIGTAQYKIEIEAAIVEVEKLNDARQVQLNRVKLVEREKSALEGRKKEADAYLRDQNELVHNQSALWQFHAHQASSNMVIYQQAVEEATAELEEEVETQVGTRKEVDDLQKEYDELVADTKNVEKETNEIVKQLAVLDRTDVQLQEKKKSFTAKVKKLKKTLSDDSHARSEADTWVKNYGEEIEKVRKDLDGMEKTLEQEEVELEKVRDSLKGKTEVFSAQIESLQKDLQPWAAKIADKQAAIDLTTNERDLLVEKTEGVKAAVEEAEESLKKLKSGDKEKEEKLNDLKKEKRDVEREIAGAQAKLDAMDAEDARLRTKATVARQKSDEAKASQAASRSQGNVLSSLTKLKEQGRLNGFHGRLGNLGRIDDKYDIAISTACPGLDNLVADSIAVGQACIEHLRKHDLGRANVMCLDSISQRDMSPIQTPENAPRLFDLVTVKDPKLAPAFFQLLTNTLVATDLDQGKRLAFGSNGRRWRVVTLDGQLIEASGTMSGGGGKPMKGRMSSKIAADSVTPEFVAKCEQEQTVAVEALKVFLEDRKKVEKDVGALKKRVPEIEMAISKVEMDIKTSGKRIEEAQKRLTELKTQSKPEAGDVKRIAQFEKTIESLSKELLALEKESSTIDSQIKVLQEKILEVGGVKLRSQQTKVSDLKARIDHANDRLTKAEVGKAKSEKDFAKLKKAIDSNSVAMESLEEELEKVGIQIMTTQKDSELVRVTAERAQELLGEKQEELGEMKKVLDEKVEIINQFRKRELALKQHLDAQQKLLDESEKLARHWSDKIGELELNAIEESDDEDEEEEVDGEAKAGRQPKLDKNLRQWTSEELADIDLKVLKAKISMLEERLSKANLDLAVIQEYARREAEFLKRAADLDEVTKERDAAKKLADDLRGQRLKQFMEGFGIISMKLKEMYQMITLGGNAELELVDSLDPFSEGIIFSVMPPKKSWKNISNLSGGEKTLSSLALVFALHVFKPTPLYFMDEIDAALDFRNVSIVANYIKDRTKNAQFVVISLRNNMFELSSRLLGIYKHDNATRAIAIDNTDLRRIPNSVEQDGDCCEVGVKA